MYKEITVYRHYGFEVLVNAYRFKDYVIYGFGIYDLKQDRLYATYEDEFKDICKKYDISYDLECVNKGFMFKYKLPIQYELKKLELIRLKEFRNKDLSVIRNYEAMIYDYIEDKIWVLDLREYLDIGIFGIKWDYGFKYVIKEDKGIRIWKIRNKDNMDYVISIHRTFMDYEISFNKVLELRDKILIGDWHIPKSEWDYSISELSRILMSLGISNKIERDKFWIKVSLSLSDIEKYAISVDNLKILELSFRE